MSEGNPEDWNQVEKGQNEASDYLTIKSGEKVRLAILQGPLSYGQLYFDKPPIEGSDRKYFNVPIGTQLPGYKPKRQYAFEVVILDGDKKGEQKVLRVGQKVAEQLMDVKSAWGSITEPDIIIGKTGEKLTTKWTATATKATAERPAPKLDLRKLIVYAKAEDLQALPPAETVSTQNDIGKKISVPQGKLIADLSSAKELSMTEVMKIVKRKFDKNDLDDLTSTQASILIEQLKGM